MSESREEANPVNPKAIKSEATRESPEVSQEPEGSESGYRSAGSPSPEGSFAGSTVDERSLGILRNALSNTLTNTRSNTPSLKRNSLLNIFNNRETTELRNLRDEARILNFKSENLSNEELECKYKLFCLPSPSGSLENLIDSKTLSLSNAIDHKIGALRLVNEIGRDIQILKQRTTNCENNLLALQHILEEFF